MAKAYLLCGKVGCGKSTYAKLLKAQYSAMILSSDELMLALFDEQLGDNHQAVLDKSISYLLKITEELVSLGVNVVLDFGFWSYESRQTTKEYFCSKGIQTELHYIKVPEDQRNYQLTKRNQDVEKKLTNAYYISKNTQKILDLKFEEPLENEIDLLTKKLHKIT